MKKRILLSLSLIFALICSGNFIKAQSISGKISDEGGKIISYAEIVLTKDNLKKMAISDEGGNFILKLSENGSYLMEILENGSKVYSKNITINGNITENILLPISNEIDLQEVVISKKIVQQAGDKTYFNVENSVLSKGNNGLEILQKSPKLSINSEGTVLLKNKNATILVNGRKINLSRDELNNYLSGLSSEDIKRIEIQDIGSVDQDASNMGGVINIILKNNSKGFRAISKTSYVFRKKNADQYNGGLNLNYGNEKWNIYSDVSYTENRNYGKSAGIFYYDNGQKNINNENSKYYNDNLRLSLGSVFYPNDKNTIGIEGYYNKNKTILHGVQNLDVYKENIQAMNSKSFFLSKMPSDLWYITTNYALKLDDLGSNLKFIGDIGRNNAKPFNDVYSEYSSDSSLNSHYRYNTNSVSKYYTGQLDWIQKFSTKWELNAGGKFGIVKRDNLLQVNYSDNGQWNEDFNQKQDFDNRENILASYALVSKAFGRHFIKAGLRIENTRIKGYNRLNNEDVKQDYTKLFPSLYYKYDLKNEKSLSFSYKRSIGRPSFKDLNPFVIKQNDFLYTIGNPNLQPMYVEQLELGYNTKKQTFTAYGKNTTNTIDGVYFMDQNLINYYQPQNFGKYYETGIDYSYNGNITKWVSFNFSGGLFYNSFESNNNIKNSGASFYGNLYTRIELSKDFLFELFNYYSHKNIDTNAELAYQYKMDISIRKTLMDGNLVAIFKVVDLFNTQRDKNTSYYKDFNFNFYKKWQTRGLFFSVQYTLDNKNKIKSGTVKSNNDSRDRL